MVRRFGKVYNGSRTYYEARSQTPYLSMMVDRIYRLTGDKQWLADAYETLKEEYGFWMRERLTPTGLNRYGSSASDALVDEFLVTAANASERTSSTRATPPNGSTSWGLTSSPKPNRAGTSTRATTAGVRISARWTSMPTSSCTR